MTTYITADLRRLVIERAGNCCEYCHVGEMEDAINFAIDHIIAEKHGGATTADNLCLSCARCNRHKGSDLASVDWNGAGDITPLFHPRKHRWNEHFALDGAEIKPLTPEGRVTVALLQLNEPQRLEERELMLLLGEYPCNPTP